MPGEELVKGWASVVPEGFYDLIVRIVPGVLFVGGTLIMTHSPLEIQLSDSDMGSSVIAASVFLAAAYASGILFDSAASLIARLYLDGFWRRAWRRYEPAGQWFCEKFGFRVPQSGRSIDKNAEWELVTRVCHDFLKGRNPQANALLPKMHAEAKFCNSFGIANLAFLVVYPLLTGTFAPEGRGRTLILILLIMGSTFLAGIYRYYTFTQRTFVFLSLAHEQETANRPTTASGPDAQIDKS